MTGVRLSLWAGVLCALALLIYNAAVIARTLSRSSTVAHQSTAFQTETESARQRLLVVGDSTAVGTGSAAPEDSVAGRISADFPDIGIDNRAQNGARSRDLVAQLQGATGPFKVILMQIGGNDVLRFTSKKQLQHDIDNSLRGAGGLSEHVILMTIGDVGNAPALPWPLSKLFSWRSRVVREVLRDSARRHGAQYLDMLPASDEQSPFLADPDRYYSKDYLHPSGAGYGVWYKRLREETALKEWLQE